MAHLLVHVLEKCGDNLTRANIMKQAADIQDFDVPMLLPGIQANTSAKDFYPVEQMQLSTFNGEVWELFGELLSSE